MGRPAVSETQSAVHTASMLNSGGRLELASISIAVDTPKQACVYDGAKLLQEVQAVKRM